MAAIKDVFTLQFRSTVGGQLVSNTFHVRQNPTAGDVDAAHLIALLASTGTDSLVTAYRGVLSTGGTLDDVVCRLVPDPLFPDEPRAEAVRTVGLAGTGSRPFNLPLECCAVLTVGTDLAGRRYRGRAFMPPALEQAQVSQESFSTSGSYWAAITSLVNELVKTTYPSGASHYGGAWNDNDLCIYSLAARAADASPYYARVTGFTRRARVHWLRSRGPAV